jgi:hypothetical protein
MESKHEEKEGKESDDMEPLATVEVQRIDIESGPQPLSSKLDMEVDFALDRPLSGAYWVIKVIRSYVISIHTLISFPHSQYMVDTVRKRHIIELGRTDTTDYSEGASHFTFSVRCRSESFITTHSTHGVPYAGSAY